MRTLQLAAMVAVIGFTLGTTTAYALTPSPTYDAKVSPAVPVFIQQGHSSGTSARNVEGFGPYDAGPTAQVPAHTSVILGGAK